MKYNILIFLFCLVISSCKKEDAKAPPIADFTYTIHSTSAPTSVAFTNYSQNASFHYWDFGDGSSSKLFSPTHGYEIGGEYTVTLTETQESGVQDVVSKKLVIGHAPSKVRLDSILLWKYPVKDYRGRGWDSLTGPDIYFRLNDHYGNNYWQSEYYTDVDTSDLPLSFSSSINFPVIISDLDNPFSLGIYDRDEQSGDDQIDSIYTFTFRDRIKENQLDYPNSYDPQDISLSYTVFVTWLD